MYPLEERKSSNIYSWAAVLYVSLKQLYCLIRCWCESANFRLISNGIYFDRVINISKKYFGNLPNGVDQIILFFTIFDTQLILFLTYKKISFVIRPYMCEEICKYTMDIT